jgi:hypothetical protein
MVMEKNLYVEHEFFCEVMELHTDRKSLQLASDNFKKQYKFTKCTEPKGRWDMNLP